MPSNHSPPHSNGVNHDPEQSPLLSSSASPSSTPKETPLPTRTLSLLLFMRLAEPINFTIIFPFINEMVSSLPGATSSPASVGFYAGIIESLFALSQTLTILYWGSLSDRIGRKPVLLIGLTGVALSATLFGLAETFLWAVLARALAGVMNGNVAIVKSVVGEITDDTNRARAFNLIPLTWTVGCWIGPLLGGYLSRPSEKYPQVFGREGWLGCGGLWERKKYLLPCSVSAVITVSVTVVGWGLLEETLPEIVQRKRDKAAKRAQISTNEEETAEDVGSGYGAISPQNRPYPTPIKRTRSGSTSAIRVQSWHSGYTPSHTPPRSPSPSSSSPCSHSPQPVGALTLLSISQIQRILLSYAFLALISVSLDAVLVLFLYTPIHLGGVGFSSDSTGILLSINGLGGAIVQILLFPPLQHRFGTLRLYQLSMFAFPLSIVFLPLANIIARTNTSNTNTIIWVLLLASTSVRILGGMAYASNMILVNQCSTLTPGTALGTLNSLAQMSSSCTRAIGPYIANTLFAFSVTKHLIGGQLVWVVLGVVGMVGVGVCLMLEDLEKRERVGDET